MSTLHAHVEACAGPLTLDVTLDTGAGPLAIVGPNGAGKTTLLLALLGAVPARRGRIEIGGALLLDTARGIDVPLESRRIGYVPQSYGLFPHLSVRDNLEFALASAVPSATRSERRRRASRLLAELELEAHAEQRPGTLSGGEQQRVALARALAVEPRALLLDEPLAALDVHARRTVRAFLAEYLQKLALPTLVVTHDAGEARLLGRRIAVLENGRVVQCGSFRDLESAPATRFVEEFVSAPELAAGGDYPSICGGA